MENKWVMLLIMALLLSACGGSSPSSETPGAAPNANEAANNTTNNAINSSHAQSFGNSPLPGSANYRSKRFDEHGNLIGVYGIPYVPPKSGKP